MKKLFLSLFIVLLFAVIVVATITQTGNDLDVPGNITGNIFLGGMFYHNHTGTELNFAVDGTYYNLFFTNASHLNGFTYQGGFNQISNLTLTAEGGCYKAEFMGIGDGQNNHVYFTSLFVNGVNQVNCGNHHKMAAGGDVITQTSTCIVNLETGDIIDIRTADEGGTGTGNYYGGNLVLFRVGD